MSVDFAIAPAEIQVVLNQFEDDRLHVTSPLHGIDVATLDTRQDGYRCIRIAGPGAFEAPSVQAWGATIDERPVYADLVECLLFSGIVPYANFEAFLERRRMLQSLRRGIRFVPDTNLFYHGFPVWSGLAGEEFLVPGLVREEIVQGMNRKYSQEDLAVLRRSTARGSVSLLDEFLNQRTRRARRATHLARASLQAITDEAAILDCEEPGTTDREENDARIVRAVRRAQAARQRVPVVLTADQNLSALCEAEGVESFLFTIPRDPTVRAVGFAGLCRWLHALAVVWGVIRVNNVLLFSEWRGRIDQRYPFKVRFLHGSVADMCIRDLKLCRALGGLGIGR
ncbi:MAG TPA: PIN domain-containing protein [Methanoregulaceae archaeon]|nr:PIN domain-containing protein [Methanoregulaceae archaeon]HQJ87125.1 PIN domain-containing protein [Methanoregulaceae archaeon]